MKRREFKTHEEYLASQSRKAGNREIVGAHPKLNAYINLFKKYITKTDVILDAGARDGYAVEVFESQGYPNVIGVELVQVWVNWAKSKGRCVVQGDISDLKWWGEETQFDGIFCSHTIEHARYPEKAIKEFYRLLKPDGVCLIVVPKEVNSIGEAHASSYESLKDLKDFIHSQINCKTVFEKAGTDLVYIFRVIKDAI